MTSLFGLKQQPGSSTTDAAWEYARELVRRGPPFGPSEATALAAAFPVGVDRAMQDGLDVLTVQVCARFPRPSEPEAADEPTPFDVEIAAAEVELEAAHRRELTARAECQRLQDRARACAPHRARWEVVMEELQAVRGSYRAREEEWLQAKARLDRLVLDRDRWRLTQDV